MKNLLYKFGLALMLIIGVSGCEFFDPDEVTNPNAADATVIDSEASIQQLQALAAGLESRSRVYLATTSRALGTFGREILPYRDSDPRFTTDWLGRALPPDPNFFAVGNTYNAPYQAIKQASVLMEAAANTSAVSAGEISGINGFAKTMQGYLYLPPLLTQFQNGIRIEVNDPLDPGPFENYDAAIVSIRSILDDGQTDLANAGSSFSFSLTSGFDGFNTPSGMIQVNRAIAARLALYAQDWAGVISALNASFMDMGGAMDLGPAHTYEGGDGTTANPFNPFFYPLDQFSTQIEVVHPGVLDDLEAGDNRGDKFFMRSPANFVSNQALQEYIATHQDARWPSNASNVPFIRNEELILMFAEASAQLGNTTDAVDAINVVRSNAGLADYTGATDLNSLIDQILFERRYSLWFEPIPHRWVDLRRYNRLTELDADFIAADESVFNQLARPQGEINWDEFFGN